MSEHLQTVKCDRSDYDGTLSTEVEERIWRRPNNYMLFL